MHLAIANRVYSSWSLRPWLLMRATGIPFDETVVPLRMPDTTAEIKAYSPTGKLPCLTDGETVVWESLAIIEHLAEKFPTKGLWPSDPIARAHARSTATEMHGGFQSFRKHCPMVVTQRFAAAPLPPDVAADVARIISIWREARQRFGQPAAGPYLYGAFSAADAMYAPVAARMRIYAISVDPIAQAYVETVLSHPAYQEWLAAAVAEPWVLTEFERANPVDDLRARR